MSTIACEACSAISSPLDLARPHPTPCSNVLVARTRSRPTLAKDSGGAGTRLFRFSTASLGSGRNILASNESCMQCLGMLKCPAPTLRTCYLSGLLLATACLMLPTEPTGQIDACFEAFDTLAPCHCLFDNTKLALSECFNEFFEGWNPNIANFGTSYVKPLVHNADNSGMLTLIAVRDFNGRDLKFPWTGLNQVFQGIAPASSKKKGIAPA